MDRLAELAAAYDEALAAGAELLAFLRAPVPENTVDQIQELLERREIAVQASVALFQPGDQEMLKDKLQALVEQQKELEVELNQVLDALRRRLQEVKAARTAARRSRQVMDAGRRGSLLDQRR